MLLHILMATTLTAAPADARTDQGMLGSITGGSVNGVVKDGIYAKVNSRGVSNASFLVAPKLALYKIALLARTSGFVRFGVVKQSCSTATMSGIELYHQCKAEAQMLRADESDDAVKPKGKAAVKFYNVDEVIRLIEADWPKLQKY